MLTKDNEQGVMTGIRIVRDQMVTQHYPTATARVPVSDDHVAGQNVGHAIRERSHDPDEEGSGGDQE